MKYLEINTNYKDVINLIKDSIRQHAPFSFTRYGDGEISILNNDGSNKVNVCNLWGYDVENWEELYNRLRIILLDSINNSHVIGLFDNNGVLKNHLKTEKKEWSIPYYILINNDIPINLIICDHQLPRSKEIGDINEFKKILNGEPLHIISPHVQKLKANKINELLDTDVTYTKWNMPMNLDDRPMLFKELDNIKENVVIYGTSLGGKDIGSYLTKNHGKITIDFGATLDAWAGIESRQWFKKGGVQEYCMIKNK